MFWERFVALCEKAGRKPNPVGAELGVSSATITKWSKGAIPGGDSLIKVASYFGVSVDYLLGLSDTAQVASIGDPFLDLLIKCWNSCDPEAQGRIMDVVRTEYAAVQKEKTASLAVNA